MVNLKDQNLIAFGPSPEIPNNIDSPKILIEAQHNRNLMSAALAAVGFVNYPTEYWQWSFGDIYWAIIQKI
jgi:D-alanyl-D-alanine dipeptidase